MDINLLIKQLGAESIHAFMKALDRLSPFVYGVTSETGEPDRTIIKANAGFHPDIAPGSRDEMIAKGCFEWLNSLSQNDNGFLLSNKRVKELHRKIFIYSERDQGTCGNYRAPLDEKMEAIYETTNEQLKQDDRHPLFTISLFRTAFLEAMPFVTGNGLIANLISYALLLDHGYGFVINLPLVASLNNASSSPAKNQLTIIPEELSRLIEDRFIINRPSSLQKNNVAYLNPRQTVLLEIIRQYAPVKISDIMNHMPDENRNTIKKDLVLLKQFSLVITKGEGRGVLYMIPV